MDEASGNVAATDSPATLVSEDANKTTNDGAKETAVVEQENGTIEKIITETAESDGSAAVKMQVDDVPSAEDIVEKITDDNIKIVTIKTDENSVAKDDSANSDNSAKSDVAMDESRKNDCSDHKSDETAKPNDSDAMQVDNDVADETPLPVVVEEAKKIELEILPEKIEKEIIADVPKVEQCDGETNGTNVTDEVAKIENGKANVEQRTVVVDEPTTTADVEEKKETNMETDIKEKANKIEDVVDFKMDEPKVVVDNDASAEAIPSENKMDAVIEAAVVNGDENKDQSVDDKTIPTENNELITSEAVVSAEIVIAKPIVDTPAAEAVSTESSVNIETDEIIKVNGVTAAEASSSNGNSIEGMDVTTTTTTTNTNTVPIKVHHIVVSAEQSTTDESVSSPTLLPTQQQQKTEVSEVIETNSESSKEKVSRVEITIEQIDKQLGQTTQTTTHIVKEMSITEHCGGNSTTKNGDSEIAAAAATSTKDETMDTAVVADEKKIQNGKSENGIQKSETDSDKENDIDEVAPKNGDELSAALTDSTSEESLKKCSDKTAAAAAAATKSMSATTETAPIIET